MPFAAKFNQDNKWFSSPGVTPPALTGHRHFPGVSLIPESAVKSTSHCAHPPVCCSHLGKVRESPLCLSQVRPPQKTAQACWAAFISPHKPVLSPLHHSACSPLNLLQFVHILLGPACLKSEHAVHTRRALLRRLPPPPRETSAGPWR